MATVAEPCSFLPQVELIETDGEPLESDWHRLAMNLLIDSVIWHWRARTDYFVGGNMFIYFNAAQARNRDIRGPDFFLVQGVPLNPPRPYWAIWLEGGRYPDMIIELSSPTTILEDKTTKKDIYESIFHTHEYFCYDPSTGLLEGWRLINHHYEPIVPNERGWLWSEQLRLWIGTWKGKFQGKEEVYVRFYDLQGNLVPIAGEAYYQEAVTAKAQAEEAQKQAEAAQQQAEADRKRAEAAEAELARLKAQLDGKDGK